MDENTEILMAGPEIPQVQITHALIALSEAVSQSRDSEARQYLLTAMDCLVYQINPKRGEVVEIK